MSPSKDLTSKRHFIFISFITLLKFGLTFSNESNYLNCSCPSVLYKCSILYFNVKAGQIFTSFGLDIVLVDVMNTAISCGSRGSYVVVLTRLITSFMVEFSLVKRFSEFSQVLDAFKYQPASGNVIHSRKLHSRKAPKFVEDCISSLVSLRYGDVCAFCSGPQDGLECIQNTSMSSTPLFYDLLGLLGWHYPSEYCLLQD